MLTHKLLLLADIRIIENKTGLDHFTNPDLNRLTIININLEQENVIYSAHLKLIFLKTKFYTEKFYFLFSIYFFDLELLIISLVIYTCDKYHCKIY